MLFSKKEIIPIINCILFGRVAFYFIGARG
jgi:hypothetical protein